MAKKRKAAAAAKGKAGKQIRIIAVAEFDAILEKQKQAMLDAIYGRTSTTVTPARRAGKGGAKRRVSNDSATSAAKR